MINIFQIRRNKTIKIIVWTKDENVLCPLTYVFVLFYFHCEHGPTFPTVKLLHRPPAVNQHRCCFGSSGGGSRTPPSDQQVLTSCQDVQSADRGSGPKIRTLGQRRASVGPAPRRRSDLTGSGGRVSSEFSVVLLKNPTFSSRI